VGLGPKGLFALERLLDHARCLGREARLRVDVFEPHDAPGAGPVYDPGQPSYLRMNFAAANLDMWWPSGGVVPRAHRRSFVEWRQAHAGGDDDYPPRAQVGRYLCDGFEALLRHAPPKAEVALQRARVQAVHPDGDRWEVRTADGSGSYDEVLVAVGHQGGSGVFPVERMLGRERIAPGATVAIRGFALTFIDAALALTEGRGGTFEPLHHPYRLRYVSSPGDVEVIFPFSRTGKPMLAKPGPDLAAGTPELQAIAERARAQILALEAPISLERDLLPILSATTRASLRTERSGSDSGFARSVRSGSDPDRAAGAIEMSLAVGAGLAPPDRDWALGHVWRALYPAIVSRLGGDELAERDWPAFLRLAAEMERVAFGPPAVNAAKLLALVDAGVVDLTYLRDGPPVTDAVVDAVLPGPGALGHGGLLADLVADGHASVAPGRRGLDVACDGSCRARDGSISAGLSAVGRPTEDSVIGNDTLARGLHPHADRWARRVVRRTYGYTYPSERESQLEAIPASRVFA
jgi:uncharacterized NAD(P)/FAD-binding protein YdhS